MIRRLYPKIVLTVLIAAIFFAALGRGGHMRVLWLPISTVIFIVFGGYLIFFAGDRLFSKKTWKIDAAVLAFSGWAVLSIYNSINPEQSIYEVMRLCTLVMVFFLAACMLTPLKFKNWFLFAIMAIGLIQAAYGLVNFISESPVIDWHFLGLFPPSGGKVRGTFLNKNHFAGLIEMSALVSFGLVAAVTGKRGHRSSQMHSQRLLLLAGGAFMLLALLLSLSRAGWASTLAGVAIFLSLYWWHKHPKASRIIASVVILLIISGAFLAGMERDNLVKRIQTLTEFASSPDELTRIGRINIWHSSLDMIRENPATGTGWGTYKYAFPAHRKGSFLRGPAFAHNDYLQIAAGMGIPGLFLFLVFCALVFRKGVGLIEKDENDIVTRAAPGILAALFALLVHGIMDFNLMIPANAMIFMGLAGVIAGYDSEDTGGSGHGRRRKVAAVVFSIVVFGLIAKSGQLYYGEIYNVQGEGLQESGELEEAARKYKKAASIVPKRADYQRKAARVLVEIYRESPDDMGPLYDAGKIYSGLVDLVPTYPYYWYEAGLVLHMLHYKNENIKSPEPYYEKSLEIDPDNPRFLAGMVNWQLFKGRRENARQYLARLVLSYPDSIKLFGDAVLTNDRQRVEFGEMIEKDPAALLKYAEYLRRRGHEEIAVERILRLPREEELSPQAAVMYANNMSAMGMPEEAEKILRDALGKDPGDTYLARRLVLFLIRAGKLEEAVRANELFLARGSDSQIIDVHIARLARRMERYDVVLEHYERAARSDLRSSYRKEAYLEMGDIHYDRGDLEKARVNYIRGKALAPDDKKLSDKLTRVEVEIEYRDRHGR